MFADLPPVSVSASDLSPQVAQRASRAMRCQQAKGSAVRRLLVVDLGRPSKERRLWAFDVSGPQPKLILEDWVAHGAGSDPDKDGLATLFGNAPESGRSSLGLFQVAEAYVGKHGRSYRLDGLTKGWNDAARQRAVVFHPAAYVREGSVGRSLGCPAVRQATLDALEKQGLAYTFLWIDGPDAALENSPSVSCGEVKARDWIAVWEHNFEQGPFGARVSRVQLGS